MAPSPDDVRLAWLAALERLEHDTEVIRHAIRVCEPPALEDWDLPEAIGPIPDDLLARARTVQERQVTALNALAEALRATRRQREYTERVTATSASHPAPAYVDLDA